MTIYNFGTIKVYEKASDNSEKIIDLLILNNLKLNKIMAEQKQLADDLKVVTAQVAKIAVEVSATLEKVEALEAALEAADDVSPEVQAAFDDLKAQVIAVDDLIPDATTTTTTEVPEDSTTTTTTEEETTTTEAPAEDGSF